MFLSDGHAEGRSGSHEVWIEATYRAAGGGRVEIAIGRDFRRTWVVGRRTDARGYNEIVIDLNGPRADSLVAVARQLEEGLICRL